MILLLPEPPGDIILGQFLFRVLEDLLGLPALDQFPEIHEPRIIAHPCCLLHVVGDDDDRILLLEQLDQVLDLCRCDRVERRAGLVHQDHFRFHRERPGNAEPLLLAAREPECRIVQPVLHLVPEGCMAQALLHDPVQLGFVLYAMHLRAVGHILVDGFRERVGFLEDHPDFLPERDHISPRCMDILIIKRDLPGDLHVIDQVVQPVEAAQQRGLAAARGADQGGHLVLRDLHRYGLERMLLMIPEIEIVCGNDGGFRHIIPVIFSGNEFVQRSRPQ